MRYGWILLLGFVAFLTSAQEITSLRFESGVIVKVTADAPISLTFDGLVGSRVSFEVEGLGEDAIDPIAWLMAPNGQALAYSDDTVNPDGNLSPVAKIELTLPGSGIYTLIVDSFNGVSDGEVGIMARELTPIIVEQNTSSVTSLQLVLFAGEQVRYTFSTIKGTRYSIQVIDESGLLDPVAWLETTNGQLLARNDDYETSQTRLNTLDSALTWTSSADGAVTLVITDFLGRGGLVSVIITRQ